MVKILVHIGYPRTGTTWFQTQVFPYIQNYSFLQRKYVRQHLIHPLPHQFRADALKEYFTDQALIISEEMIVGRYSGGEINLLIFKDLVNRIRQVSDSCQFIVFIRRQQDMIYSLYNQYIRRGGTYSLTRFLEQHPPMKTAMLFGREFLRYDLTISLLKDTFGPSSVQVFLFEELQEDPTGFLHRFLHIMDLRTSTDSIDFSPKNTGYSPRRLFIQRMLNHLSRRGMPFKQNYLHLPLLYRLIRTEQGLVHNMNPAHAERLNAFCKYYKDSNARLQQMEGLEKISDYGYILP